MAPPVYKSQVIATGSNASTGQYTCNLTLPAGITSADLIVCCLTYNGLGRSTVSFTAGYTQIYDYGNFTYDASSHCIFQVWTAQGSAALSGTAFSASVAAGSTFSTWALNAVLLTNAGFNANPPGNIYNSYSGGNTLVSNSGYLTTPAPTASGTDYLNLNFATINSNVAGSGAALTMTADGSQTQIANNPVPAAGVSSGYAIGFGSGYGATGTAKSFLLGRNSKGGFGLNLAFAAPPKAASGRGSIVGTAKAKVTRGAKKLTATRKATLTPGVGLLAARGVASQPIAKSGYGAVSATSTVTARTGSKGITRQGALLGVALANAARGAKALTAPRNGQLAATALVRSAGVKGSTARGMLVAVGYANASNGTIGRTGQGRLAPIALLHAGSGVKAARGLGSNLVGVITLHALTGIEGEYGWARLTVDPAMTGAGTGAHSGQAHTSAVCTCASSGYGERAGHGEISTTAEMFAGEGVPYRPPRTFALVTTATVGGQGRSNRHGVQEGAFLASIVLSAQFIPEHNFDVHHSVVVIAAGQGYLPIGTKLAPKLNGKYIVADDDDTDTIVLRSSLNVGPSDIQASGSVREDLDGQPSIYLCTATAH